MLAGAQVIIFRSFSGLEGYEGISRMANYSFGSLGFPDNLCSKTYLNWDKSDGVSMVFTCQQHTQISKVLSSGIISYDSADDYPGLVEVFAKCYYDPTHYDVELFPYMKYFDEQKFNKSLMT